MIDASVVVSAAIRVVSRPGMVLATLQTTNRIALSGPVLDEISAVLSRSKFRNSVPDAQRRRILNDLMSAAVWCTPAEPVCDCRDPKDDIYLELALAAGADAIVSGDNDLLVLHPWRGIPVLSPAGFLAWAGLPG